MKTPQGFEKWNPAWRGAFRKGWQAGFDGAPIGSCPYEDKRKDCGRLTWSRAFIAAWTDGWRAGDDERRAKAIDEFYTDRNNSGQAALAK